MLSCKEVTRLLSLSQERPLKISENMQLKVHLMMCKRCQRFSKNLNSIRQTMQHFSNRED